MKNLYLIIITIFISGCLKTKKSAFEISSPAGFFGFMLWGQTSLLKDGSASVPKNPPSALSFTDTDLLNYGKIGGPVNVFKAADESDIDSYNIYFGTSASVKYGAVLSSIPKSGSDIVFSLSANTAVPSGVTHILAYSSNAKGENPLPASALIKNYDKLAKYLYVYDSSANIKYFTVSSSGILLPVTTYSAGPGTVRSVASDPAGRFLFCAAGNNILPRTVSSTDGSLTPVSFTGYISIQGAVTDSSGQFLYASASNAGSYEISSFSINQSSAAVTLIQSSAFNVGTSASSSVFLDRNGKFAFVLRSTGFSSLYSYALNPSTGEITAALQNTGMPLAQNYMVSHPSLDIVYLASGTTVYAFSVNQSSGALSGLGSIAAAGGGLKGMALEKSGRWLYAASSSDNTVYKVDLNSEGIPVSASAAVTGLSAPAALISDPGGRLLFAADSLNTRSYQISSSDGSLSLASTAAGSSSVGAGIAAVSYTE